MEPVAQILTLADAATPAPMGMNWMVMLLLFVGMWFLLIAPQRKKQKAHRAMMSALGIGDEVLTAGGIHGVISNVKDDRFVVKIADNTKIEVSKAFIQAKIAASKEK